MKGRHALRVWPLIILAFLAGCAGVPERPVDWLPADALSPECSVFISLRVEGNEKILYAATGLGGPDNVINKELSKTDYIYLGLQYSGDTPDLHIAGSGAFRSQAIRTGLSVRSDWERRKSVYPWYENGVTGEKISFPGPGLFFYMSGGDMEPMLQRLGAAERTLPGYVKRAMVEHDIVLFVPAFDPALARLFLPEVTTFPAESFFIRMTALREGYSMQITSSTGDEKSARVLSSALKFVLLARARKAEGFSMADFLKEVRVGTVDNEVRVSGVFFNTEEILRFAETVKGKDGEETP